MITGYIELYDSYTKQLTIQLVANVNGVRHEVNEKAAPAATCSEVTPYRLAIRKRAFEKLMTAIRQQALESLAGVV